MPELSAPVRDFLNGLGWTPVGLNEFGNLVCKRQDGKTTIVSQKAVEVLSNGPNALADEAEPMVGDPATTFLVVYRAVKEIAELIIICYEIYQIMQDYGIIDGNGTHEPGEPYAPYWPSPHFEIINGSLNWN